MSPPAIWMRKPLTGSFRSSNDCMRSHGLTSILVTHNQELAGRCDRVMRLEAGHMEEDLAKTGKPIWKAQTGFLKPGFQETAAVEMPESGQ